MAIVQFEYCGHVICKQQEILGTTMTFGKALYCSLCKDTMSNDTALTSARVIAPLLEKVLHTFLLLLFE